MHEQVDSLKAGEADLKAKISQLEHEQDKRAKKQDKGDETDKITLTAMIMMSKAV